VKKVEQQAERDKKLEERKEEKTDKFQRKWDVLEDYSDGEKKLFFEKNPDIEYEYLQDLKVLRRENRIRKHYRNRTIQIKKRMTFKKLKISNSLLHSRIGTGMEKVKELLKEKNINK